MENALADDRLDGVTAPLQFTAETGETPVALVKVPGAGLDERTVRLMDWVLKLTRTPGEMGEGDVDRLREIGWSDSEISAAGFVCSYFNFINRVADGLGVDLEPWMHDAPPLGPGPW